MGGYKLSYSFLDDLKEIYSTISEEYSSLKESDIIICIFEHRHELAQEVLGINPQANYAFRIYQDGEEIMEGHLELKDEEMDTLAQRIELEFAEDGFKRFKATVTQTSN